MRPHLLAGCRLVGGKGACLHQPHAAHSNTSDIQSPLLVLQLAQLCYIRPFTDSRHLLTGNSSTAVNSSCRIIAVRGRLADSREHSFMCMSTLLSRPTYHRISKDEESITRLEGEVQHPHCSSLKLQLLAVMPEVVTVVYLPNVTDVGLVQIFGDPPGVLSWPPILISTLTCIIACMLRNIQSPFWSLSSVGDSYGPLAPT